MNITNQLKSSTIGRWFYARDRSEQKIISVVGAVVVFALLWAYVWKPVADWRELEQNRQQNAQQTLDWLNANKDAAVSAANTKVTSGQGARALIPIINRAAKAQQLALNSLAPDSNGVVGVVLQGQSFNKIISWIAQLEENNNVFVQRANFDQQGTTGYVNAQLRLN